MARFSKKSANTNDDRKPKPNKPEDSKMHGWLQSKELQPPK